MCHYNRSVTLFNAQQRRQIRRFLLQSVGSAFPQVEDPSGPVRRILVIRPDHLGDFILNVPAIERLRDALPNAVIDLLVGPWNEELANWIPGIGVRTLSFPGFQRGPKGRIWHPYALLWNEANTIRREHYDLALVLRFDHWWGGLLAHLAGIPRIVGYAHPDVAPFLTYPRTYLSGRHETLQSTELVDTAIRVASGRVPNSLPAKPSLIAPEAEWPAKPTGPYVVIHPGAGAAVKRWSIDGFRDLSAEALQRGFHVVVSGGTAEAALVSQVRLAIAGPSLAVVAEPLPVLAAALSGASVVLGPDSGVLHLASALGVPTVRLYGPVDWRLFGPWADPASEVVASSLPCVPCNRLDWPDEVLDEHPCVRNIEMARVRQAVNKVLSWD